MKNNLLNWSRPIIIVCLVLVGIASVKSQSALVTLRPSQIDVSTETSQSAVLMTLSGYSQDDAKYRLYNGSNQYNCWDEVNDVFVTSNSYANGPSVPGTPTTSSTFWILFERGSNTFPEASYRDRLGPAYASPNYQTVALPAAASITAPQSIVKSDVLFTVWSDYSVKYVVLGFDALTNGTLICAAPTGLTTGDFDLLLETGTVIRRIEIRDVSNNLIETVTGTWPTGITVLPPTNFSSITVNNTQINLGWTLNASSNNVVLAWSADGIFGTPTGTYTSGASISGGGTVLYVGNATTFNHNGLNPNTTYHYKVWSFDGSQYSPGVSDNSTTYPNPAVTTLPYTEDFSTGLGLCYTHNVSGPLKFWMHSSSGEYAFMNGYNTGLLEEDWMILPAINFNNYTSENLTFESFMNFGSDDAENYFKLLYSTNYAGIGDPTLATWTELSFNYPTDLSTWTPSGTVDLSSITGASVYIAFKYHYNPTFYRSWQIDNISIISGVTPALTATPSSLSGFTYVTGNGPSAVQSYQLSGNNLVGSGNISVTAPTNYEISTNGTTFSASLSLPFGSSVITGQPVTISVRLKAGLAIGNYNAEAITHSGGGAANLTVNCSGSVTGLVPSITAETLPQWIQGINGSNGKRVPFAYRVSIGNLMPSATYRYYNKVVIGTDNATTDGAGNSIFVADAGSFTRTSSTSMGTPGEYSEFTTDASGNYSGWFMTEPTGNARFTPGNAVFMRIMLNDGNGGTSVATRLTTAASANVINFGTENIATEGTGIRGISEAMAGNIVYLYDNTAGTGRPIYGSSIETTGIDFNAIGSYATFYSTDVQGNDGSWGGIVPNVLPDGIRRVEERSNADGSIVAVHTSDDGVWGVYDTRNPFGGDTDILIINLMPAGNPVLTVTPSVLNGFTYLEGSGPSAAQTYQLSGTDLQGSGIVTVTAPADYEISADGVNYMLTLNFTIVDGEITGQPVTVSVRLKAGLAVDDYNGEAIVNSGGGATDKMVTCNGSVTSGSAPALANVTLPLWIQGINGTNAERVTFAFKAKLINLTPSTTYRYYNKVVVGTDTPTTDGAGNAVFVATDGTFTRTSSTSLANPGEYGEFTTDAEGTYFGWFITEPTGNARFTPGNQLFMRISINDGADGTTVDNRLTTVNYTTVLQFGTEAIATHGTAIRGISDDDPKDFVFLYDNVVGTGRPLYATQIETTGVDFCATTVYAPFYCEDVAGWDGEWGGIVPNMNAAGLQRVEVRSFTDGTIVNSYNMASGIWIATDTHNPTGGITDVLVIDLTGIGITNPETAQQNVFSSGREIKVLSPVTTEISVSLYNMSGQLVFSRNLKGSNEYLIQTAIPSGVYIARVVGNNKVTGNKLIIR